MHIEDCRCRTVELLCQFFQKRIGGSPLPPVSVFLCLSSVCVLVWPAGHNTAVKLFFPVVIGFRRVCQKPLSDAWRYGFLLVCQCSLFKVFVISHASFIGFFCYFLIYFTIHEHLKREYGCAQRGVKVEDVRCSRYFHRIKHVAAVIHSNKGTKRIVAACYPGSIKGERFEK